MTTTVKLSDTELKDLIEEELEWTPNVNSARIGVGVSHGSVTLSGEVDSYPERLVAERAVLRVRGVTAVAEEITVKSDWGTVSDSDVAREAAEALERAIDVPAEVKAVVHDHAVTLSGPVTWQFQREAANRTVRYLRGVSSVHNTITIKPNVSAVGLENAITGAFVRNAQLEGKAIHVTTDGAGVATLTGTVNSWSERNQANTTAWSAPGVSGVINQLHVV